MLLSLVYLGPCETPVRKRLREKIIIIIIIIIIENNNNKNNSNNCNSNNNNTLREIKTSQKHFQTGLATKIKMYHQPKITSNCGLQFRKSEIILRYFTACTCRTYLSMAVPIPLESSWLSSRFYFTPSFHLAHKGTFFLVREK